MSDGVVHIFGAGGAAIEIADLVDERYPDALIHHVVGDGYPLGYGDQRFPVVRLDDVDIRVGRWIVALGDGLARRRVAEELSQAGAHFFTVVSGAAWLSPSSQVGVGTVVYPHGFLGASARVGCHVQLNAGCSVSHNCVVDDFATLSPGVRLAGHVVVERGAFLGIGSNVIPGHRGEPLVIGAGAVVAAGACVVKHVPPDSLVAGVPAVVKRSLRGTKGYPAGG